MAVTVVNIGIVGMGMGQVLMSMSAKEQMDRLIRESEKLQRKSEQLNVDIEKLRSQIKKFEYNQLHPKKPRP